MYILALCVIIMYKVADISGMSGVFWGGLTLLVALGLDEVIPVIFWSAPLACVIVYILLFCCSLRKGPQ
jgi:hypothetical protein